MRAKAIAAGLALGVVLLVAPAGASAKPGFYKLPGYRTAAAFLFGRGPRSVVVAAINGQISLIAERRVEEDGEQTVSYTSPLRDPRDALHLDLGRAGRVDLRFVVTKTEREPLPGCSGGPAITEQGVFVGTLSFHPPGGLTDVSAHRLRGAVTRVPDQVCRGHRPQVSASEKRIRRLVAGDSTGDRRFEATSYPAYGKGLPAPTVFRAEVTRTEGALTISDRATASTGDEGDLFRIPSLDALPASATVEPPAPFSGTAAFELPSRQEATVSGDLAVELPEAGVAPLVGPGTAAGVCRGFACTRSLPKELRPDASSRFYFFFVSSSEFVPSK